MKRNKEQDRQSVPHCGSPLIYYFLQHDSAFGERELRREVEPDVRVIPDLSEAPTLWQLAKIGIAWVVLFDARIDVLYCPP